MLLALAAAAAGAEERIDVFEQVDFDRPEAWGMKFAAAVTDFAAVEAPRPLEAGAVELGFEAASVPSLSADERRIGFVGTKEEDLDRTPVYGRLRVEIGLGHQLALELGVVPPIELDGLTPRLLAVALARPLLDRGRLRLGLRLGGQFGSFRGDITCSRSDVSAGDDPVQNPFGCETPSDDELETRLASLELVAARGPEQAGGFEPFLALAAHHLDGRFQVDARYSGIVDRTRLETDGFFWSAALGASGAIADRWRLAGSLYYSPLEIQRPGHSSANEPVFNLRLALFRQIR
jgi:hypothetical protein